MKALFFVCLCSCMLGVHAQYQLSGTVKDAAGGLPVPYATAALLRPDSSAVTGTTTGDDGRFVLENINAGNWLLQVSFIGYQKEYRRVNVSASSDLGEIALTESASKLEEVVVEGRRALIEQKLDRMVVNVSGNMITGGSSAYELLRQMPGLVVGENGSVTLNGRPATIYIDGRPSRLPAEQVANMLNGMQGDLVDRVELIGNPSARYEAGMSSAIVDIKLKRDATLGLNGTVAAGAGFTDHDFVTRGGVGLNYRNKRVNVFGSYTYYKYPSQTDIYQRRNFTDDNPVIYDQYSHGRYAGPDHTLRAGIDYFIDKKQTVGFLFNGTSGDSDGTFDSEATVIPADLSRIDSTVYSDSRLTEKSATQMYNLNYRVELGEGETLNADADYGRVYADNWQNMHSTYMDVGGNELHPASEFQYTGPRNIDIISLKADYTKSFSETSKMEAGLKTGQTVTDNRITYEDRYQDRWVIDDNQTNSFQYTEKVSAGYATYSRGFGKLTAMAGLRAEYTTIEGKSPTMDTVFTRSYLDLFPSAYLQYRFNDNNALNLSYSRKIDRPGFGLLNPFRTYTDQFTYESGNPDLNPSYRHTLELSYNGFLTTSYSVMNNVFEMVYLQDDATHTTAILRNNIGKRQSWNISGGLPLEFEKYSMILMTQIGWDREDSRYNGLPFTSDFWSAYLQLQHRIQILPTLRLNIEMMGYTGGWQGITKFGGFWEVDTQLEKTFFDKRLSLTLSCTDLFNSRKLKGRVVFGNIDQILNVNHNYRRGVLTVRFRFGSQQIEKARERDSGIEDEIVRTQTE